jgi:hypothetical protein
MSISLIMQKVKIGELWSKASLGKMCETLSEK